MISAVAHACFLQLYRKASLQYEESSDGITSHAYNTAAAAMPCSRDNDHSAVSCHC